MWLEKKLFPATGLGPEDCVICPGNHDLDRNAAYSLIDRTNDPKRADALLRPERLADGFARPFAAFVEFAKEFGIEAPLAGVRELHGIRFTCLNSAWFCRDSKTDRGQLWLGLDQLRAMRLMDPEDYDKAPITVAVVHHPHQWFADAECDTYGDRPGSYGYLAARCHAILSGHTHGGIRERAGEASGAGGSVAQPEACD